MSPVVVTRVENQKSLKNHLFLDNCPIVDGSASVPASQGVICNGDLAVPGTFTQELHLITARTAFDVPNFSASL